MLFLAPLCPHSSCDNIVCICPGNPGGRKPRIQGCAWRRDTEGKGALLNRLSLQLSLGTTVSEWIKAAGPEKALTVLILDWLWAQGKSGKLARKASTECLSCCHQGAAELHQWVVSSCNVPLSRQLSTMELKKQLQAMRRGGNPCLGKELEPGSQETRMAAV